MKTAWLIISTLAIANVLAAGAFIGWLGATHRLSLERIDGVKHVFARTVAQEDQERADAAAEAVETNEAALKAAKPAIAPVGSAERIAAQQVGERIELQELIRRESEIKALRAF